MSVAAVDALPEVIVPIHDGVDALSACLASLRRTLPPQARLQLVDDASGDPRVGALLHAFSAAAPCALALHVQARNLGFVATVNAAMARAQGDVVLLNSDTVATPGWLQRLARCAATVPRLATATPWSNNAEICSFPLFCRANPVPADPDAVAAAAARLAAEYPELPTAVGFCMLIRRAALDAIGDFDAATFGRGYGEENDFCQRAAAHGLRNVLCDDAFVAHVGGQSFAPLGLAPGGENLGRLVARYPRYNAEVADFIARDPLAPRRAALAAQLTGAPAGTLS
ncbi:MAG TPA: glycosyltransferase [Pseudomonadota bacterium]|nr:glycosyltransferase [Pseudomonadota bacterium]HQX24853.1 glycosyltransferase [Pseudomonadota bacterium]HQY36801.1 glycosyltransferase [Pseudomonadota bacterium]HRA37827.1 glycosyltransferase [Pseudomonadota bacterium]